MKLMHRHHVSWLAFIIMLIGCQDGDWRQYSVDTEHSQRDGARFPYASTRDWTPMFSLGRLDGPADQVFAFVTDVGVADDGSMFVVDNQMQHIAVYDSSGNFRRTFGSVGEGPGEMLSPLSIAVIDSLVAVYDEALGRISVFDTVGTFHRSFPLATPRVRSIGPGPNGDILLTTGGERRVVVIGMDGQERGAYLSPPRIEAEVQGPYLPEPGRACSRRDEIIYTNPWTYELASIDAPTGSVNWMKRLHSEVLTSGPPFVPGVEPVMQHAGILGLVCTPDLLLHAYMNLSNRRLYYDVFNIEGEPVARLEFDPATGGEYPGFLAGASAGRLVTYRTQPFSQVNVYPMSLLTRSQED